MKIKKVKIEDLTLLEVLDDLECFALGSFECDDEQVSKRRAKKSFEIIEKEKEIIKSALERNEKLEKVWEIVKTKIISLYFVKSYKDVATYNQKRLEHYYRYDELTEEEFNLIKEMLEEN